MFQGAHSHRHREWACRGTATDVAFPGRPLLWILAVLAVGVLTAASLATCASTAFAAPLPAQTTATAGATTGDPEPTTEQPSGSPLETVTPEPTSPSAPTSAETPTSAAPTPTTTPSPSVATTQPTTATPESTSTAAPTTGGTVTRPLPPARDTTDADPLMWAIAVGVLLVCAAIVLAVVRRDRRPPAVAAEPPVTGAPADDPDSAAARLAGLEAIGEAMLDAGYSVTGVRAALGDIASVNGHPGTEVVVFPTALFVSTRGAGPVRTGAVSSGERSLALNQIDALDDIVTLARTVPTTAADVVADVAAVRALPSPYPRVQQVVAYAVLSASLAVLLGASWPGVAAASALGLLVGATLQLADSAGRPYQALVTVGLSFAVSVVVFSLTRLGLDPGVLAALIAPLVTFLPGGLLTTGVIELATGQMMAGAGRIAAGLMQLVLLAAGVVGGASLIGIPALVLDEAASPVGPLWPWLAVAVFGAAITIYRSGRASSIGWVILVLYVAYGAQVIGDIFFGGVLSAMIGALAMTPVAYLVSRQRSGPAAFASFLPAFWMLVPGTLGLVGMAGVLDGDSTGVSSLATMVSTMVAITLGILAGSAIGSRLAARGTVVVV